MDDFSTSDFKIWPRKETDNVAGALSQKSTLTKLGGLSEYMIYTFGIEPEGLRPI